MTPCLVQADSRGRIREKPSLLMLVNRGGRFSLPGKGDLIPLPEESELFLLPGRKSLGLDAHSGKFVPGGGIAVAAFAAPGHTIGAHPAYEQEADAPILPLFAYGAVGYARGRFWLAACRVDEDRRQCFADIKAGKIEREADRLLKQHSANRLVAHIVNNCVRRYACPAARNFALGRYEAPLPTSRSCPARCIGCISWQDENSPIETTPQCRLSFVPTPQEIAEVMRIHEGRERRTPIYSFGQGCEGDPLANGSLLCEAVATFRKAGGHGTVNCNTNGYNPEAVAALAASGLTSMRVSLNSARPDCYNAYYRPRNYDFLAVKESMKVARRAGVFVSLNLLYFPGITDVKSEIAALAELCKKCGVEMIQLRNLNIDPVWYAAQPDVHGKNASLEPALGPRLFMHELQKSCPWLRFGYFNPYLGDMARLNSPLPV